MLPGRYGLHRLLVVHLNGRGDGHGVNLRGQHLLVVLEPQLSPELPGGSLGATRCRVHHGRELTVLPDIVLGQMGQQSPL